MRVQIQVTKDGVSDPIITTDGYLLFCVNGKVVQASGSISPEAFLPLIMEKLMKRP